MGVKEVEGDTPHLHFPDGNVDRRINQGNLHHNLFAIIVQHPENGGGITVQDLGDVPLPAVRLDVLMEIPLGIHKPCRYRRDAEVARRLYVVTRQDPEPSRIERERLMQPELA